MITEYEFYTDERYQKQWLMLGGLICTNKQASRMRSELSQAREKFNLTKEMRWAKVSRSYLGAYKAWVDVFPENSFAKFSLFRVNTASPEWKALAPRKDRRPTKDAKLASAFYQFLLGSFGRLSDMKRWRVYPDAGFFSKDSVVDQVEFLFNRTYKKAFGAKTSRIIRVMRAHDSKEDDLIQLADVILAVQSCCLMNETPASPARRDLVAYYQTAIHRTPQTLTHQDKLIVRDWVTPERFRYP